MHSIYTYECIRTFKRYPLLFPRSNFLRPPVLVPHFPPLFHNLVPAPTRRQAARPLSMLRVHRSRHNPPDKRVIIAVLTFLIGGDRGGSEPRAPSRPFMAATPLPSLLQVPFFYSYNIFPTLAFSRLPPPRPFPSTRGCCSAVLALACPAYPPPKLSLPTYLAPSSPFLSFLSTLVLGLNSFLSPFPLYSPPIRSLPCHYLDPTILLHLRPRLSSLHIVCQHLHPATFLWSISCL